MNHIRFWCIQVEVRPFRWRLGAAKYRHFAYVDIGPLFFRVDW